jgi:Flp pilus assembly protein TadG
MMRNLMQNAVREGGRQAVVGTSTKTTANIQAAVTAYLAGQQLSNLTIQVYAADSAGTKITGQNWYDAGFGKSIAVQADADYKAMLPSFGVLPSTVRITAKSVMQSEAN